MGNRMTQIIGLNHRAQAHVAGEKILLYTDVIVRTYAKGTTKAFINTIYGSTVKEDPSGESYSGMFDEPFSLRKFTFPDGTVLFERLQADPSSSGPCAFYALQRRDGSWDQDSLWTDAEIADALGGPIPTAAEPENSFRGLEG